MYSERQSHYLRSMGIDLWVLRQGDDQDLPVPVRSVQLGPGAGDILLLCQDASESASRLGADVARSLDCEPVWGWPVGDENEPGLALESAITDRLITRVLVFGPGLLTGGTVGKARVIQTDAMITLRQSPTARKALWSQLYEQHWCSERARTS